MSAGNAINRISQILQESNLSWLLADLRQDLVVWDAWNDPGFLEAFIQMRACAAGYQPADFSPSKIAKLALDLCDVPRDSLDHPLDSIEGLFGTTPAGNPERQPSCGAAVHELAMAGSTALTWLDQYNRTNSWNGLLKEMRADPSPAWKPVLSCLYGWLDHPIEFVRGLILQAGTGWVHELAVHAILSNPFTASEQVAILIDLCHDTNGDPEPALNRLSLLRSVAQQRPPVAGDFCAKWLEIQPNPAPRSVCDPYDAVGMTTQLLENMFQAEIRRIAGGSQELSGYLEDGLSMAHNLHTSAFTRYLNQNSRRAGQMDVSSLCEKALKLHEMEVTRSPQPSFQAELALALVEQGLYEQAKELFPAAGESLPNDVYALYATAKIAFLTGDSSYSWYAASKALEQLDSQPVQFHVAGGAEGFSLSSLGQLFVELHKSSEAGRVLERALSENPNETDLLEMLAECYKASHQDQKASDTWNTLVILNPADLNYRRAYAKALEGLGEWEASLNQRSMILDTDREADDSLSLVDQYDYAHCAIQAKEPASALKVCAEVLNHNPQDCQALIFSGRAYILLGDTDEGMECFTRSTQIAPADPKGWIALAEAQGALLARETVIETLQNAAQTVPGSGEIHYMLGDIYLQENETALALPELQCAVELSPGEVKFLAGYAGALRTLGHYERSIEYYSQAYRLQPDYPGLARKYAELLLATGLLEEAIAPLERLIDSKPNPELGIYLDYARCVLTLNQQGSASGAPMKALVALNHILQHEPGHAEAKALTAEALTANGDHELAFRAYREALDTNLTQDKEWFERLSFGFGRVASALGKPDIAIAALQEASQVNPGNPAIFVALAQAYVSASLPEEAIKAARQVLVIDGENPDRLAWFADQTAKLGGDQKPEIFNSATSISKEVTTEARSALEKAIQLAPTRADLLVQLGYFQARLGETAEAQATFGSLAALDFATKQDLASAAKYLSDIGDHASAIACLEKGLSLNVSAEDERNADLFTSLALEYVRNNDPASAINTLDRAIKDLPEKGALMSLKVEILLGLGQSLDALSVIETALRAAFEPDETLHLLFLGSLIKRAMGDFPGAIEFAQQGISFANTKDNQQKIPSLDIPHRVQVAEILRALLQPERAYQYLACENTPCQADFQDEQAYFDFVFLQTELALETGGRICPDIQDIQLEDSQPSFCRCMAINARLLNKAGNYKQAEQIYQMAASKLMERDPFAGLPAWYAPYARYLAYISMIEAAQDLGLWDQAQNFGQQVAELAGNEPLAPLNLAKTWVLKAEFTHACDIFEVVHHRPAGAPPGQADYEQCKLHLDRARALVEAYRTGSNFPGDEICVHQIDRWQARAGIILHQEGETMGDPLEILSHPSSGEDTASLLLYLQKRALEDPEGEVLSRMIKLARAFPRNPSVILQLALALQPNNPAEALRSLQAVLAHHPYARNPGIAFCSILLAKLGLSLGDYSVAQQAVERSISIWPDEPGWHSLAAQIYGQLNDFVPATEHLRQAAKLAPTNSAYHLQLGQLLVENAAEDASMLTEARLCFEHVLELDPANLPALLHLADTYFHLGDYDQAETQGRNALSLAPDRADLYQLLSKVAIEKDDYQGAFEYATQAIQISPSDVQSTVSLAKALSAMGRYGEALAKLNAVIPLVHDAKSLHLERVNIIKKISGPQIALHELKALTSVYPDDFTILEALSKSLNEVGELDNAVAVAEQALALQAGRVSPNAQANLHLLIGQVFRQSGQLDPSIQHLNDAIRLAPNRLEPYLELGLARKEQCEYQQALQIFERATLIAPNDPRAPFQAGLALKESKDYKSSETMLRRAVSLAPNDLTIRRQLAAVVALNLIHNPRSARNSVK